MFGRKRIRELERKLKYQLEKNEAIQVVYGKQIAGLKDELRRCKEDRIRLSNEIGNLRIRVRKAVDE